jgi:RNA polymerase sigma factor (sigma-70 family)
MRAEDLVRRLQNRDEQALAFLYDQYSGALLGIIVRILNNREVAEDILQKTMLKVWNGIQSFDAEKSSLYTWMATIARNAAIDQKRLKSFQNQEKTETIDALVHQPQSDQTNTAGIDVQKLTADLDPKYKDVLDHIYLLGYTQQETSEQLGIPLGTVKTRLRLAIKALGEKLENEKGLFLGLFIILLILLLL